MKLFSKLAHAVTATAGIALIVTGTLSASFAPSAQAGVGNDVVHKSYVCKYVGKPGVDERLQTGQNPIWVDNHSLGDHSADVTYVGETFTDAQGKSVVIVANTAKLDPEPSIEDCPAPEGPPPTSPPPTTPPPTTPRPTTVPPTSPPPTSTPPPTTPPTTPPPVHHHTPTPPKPDKHVRFCVANPKAASCKTTTAFTGTSNAVPFAEIAGGLMLLGLIALSAARKRAV